MIRELDHVRLSADLPDQGLRAGTAGVVVHIHRGGASCEVEIIDAGGDTLCVATVPVELLQASD